MADLGMFSRYKGFGDYQQEAAKTSMANALAMAQLSELSNRTAQKQKELEIRAQERAQDMQWEREKFERDAALRRELQQIRSGGSTPYVDEATGEVVTPLPKLSATEQKAFDEKTQEIADIDKALGGFANIKDYLRKPMFSGAGASALAAADTFPVVGGLINDEKAKNTRAYQNLVVEGQYAKLKSTFPGAISNSERTALENLGALASYTPAQKAELIKNAESGLMKLRKAAATRAADIASGRQYQKAIKNESAPVNAGEARRAPDGNYYIPDPARPGKYLKVN